MKQRLLITTALIGIFGLFIYLSCCDDCPTCPGDIEPPPLGNYRCYIWDTYNHVIMSIDTPADTIVDTLHTDLMGYNFFVTPGGDKLLVLDYPTHSTQIYSTADLSHIGSLDMYGDFYFDGGDNYCLFNSLVDDKIYFIDPVTFAPYDSIPRETWFGCLDTVDNVFFGCKSEADSNGNSVEPNVIFQIDCDTRELVDSFVVTAIDTQSPILIYRMAYNRNTNELFFHGREQYTGYSYFYRYKIATESVERILSTRRPFGDVAISVDGNEMYMSDPGQDLFGISGSPYFMIFDADSAELLATVPSYLYPELTYVRPVWALINQTPDGQRLYVTAEMEGSAVVIDLQKRMIVNVLGFHEYESCNIIAIGPAI